MWSKEVFLKLYSALIFFFHIYKSHRNRILLIFIDGQECESVQYDSFPLNGHKNIKAKVTAFPQQDDVIIRVPLFILP